MAFLLRKYGHSSRVCMSPLVLRVMEYKPLLAILDYKNTGKQILCKYHSKNGVFGFNAHVEAVESYYSNPEVVKLRSENANLHRYLSAFREFGHLKANINPLYKILREVPELNPSLYGLTSEQFFSVKGLLSGCENLYSMLELEETLNKIYCGDICAEFMHLPTLEEREWFANEFELLSDVSLSKEEKLILASDLLKSQIWDNFVALKLHTVKRYGGEGAESMFGFFRELFRQLSLDNVEHLIFGMAHRGRINLLAVLLQLPPALIFRKMKGLSESTPNTDFTGDVLSHLNSSIDLELEIGKPIHVTMLQCSSHLEAVNPVACGKTRGRQRRLGDGHYSSSTANRCKHGDKVACLQVHGDAAISGQGVNQETQALSDVPHYSIGGSFHLCINNQIGYTTPGERTRSGPYCTDIAKMCSFPIIHVNGDNVESVVKATRLAVKYQRKFRRDVFVDLLCWRRWGHNELDNPRFTNPRMYNLIDNRKSVPDSYVEALIEERIMSEEEKTKITSSYTKYLTEQYQLADQYEPKVTHLLNQWSEMTPAPDKIETWDTGIDVNLLKYLGAKSVQLPEDFTVHPHLHKTHVSTRLEKMSSGQNIDWATAESLAMSSLIYQGYDVRLAGQDVGRGTFSQRHCMFVDQTTEEIYIPLNHMEEGQKGHLEVANSILSEEAVMGFEYGVSIDSPNILVVWEAQFGDFYNGAQIIIDAFISSAEEKWLNQSGLVLLLPHGYDGAGPDHSSCHPERFLQLSNSKEDKPDSERVNWNVIYPTTAAQIFHALRRQMVRNYRKPLIVIGPKVILRLPAAFSTLEDMAHGTFFFPLIDDPNVKAENVKKIVFVCGKYFYSLKDERETRNLTDTAIIRIESLCPFPTHHINEALLKYKNAKKFIWSQEEHRNMGAWSFVQPRFRNLCGIELKYAGRDVLGPAAVGIGLLHKEESKNVLKQTFES